MSVAIAQVLGRALRGSSRERPELTTTTNLTEAIDVVLPWRHLLRRLFRWNVPGGSALGLLWARENGHWRIVAYQTRAVSGVG